jgi:IS605 OrfB family transposase
LHQLSGQLAKTKSVVVLEDLDVEGMRRNRHLALAISDAGMGELRRQLVYKSGWYGSTLIVADRSFPSTQLCSCCGVLNEKVRGYEGLKQRVFECPACGLSLDRDENAAINLRRYGLTILDGELGIVPLPEGLREVTPVGEEGSGPRTVGVKPASLMQEAKARRAPRRDPQRHAERRAGTGVVSR